jgi:para-nitrobenzyl esterase
VFGTADRTPPFWPKVSAEPAQAQLSAMMTSYWASFARTGNMQVANLPRWDAYGTERAYMHFADTPQPAVDLLPGMYELHEEVVCRRRAKGGIAWNWNIGIVSPPLPAETKGCQ